MKNLLLFLCIIMLLTFKVSAQQVIKAKDAYKYVGKEITVRDIWKVGFSSCYIQAASLHLGVDTVHVQLIVYIQGELYKKNNFGVFRQDKTVELTGIVYKGKDGQLYMNETR